MHETFTYLQSKQSIFPHLWQIYTCMQNHGKQENFPINVETIQAHLYISVRIPFPLHSSPNWLLCPWFGQNWLSNDAFVLAPEQLMTAIVQWIDHNDKNDDLLAYKYLINGLMQLMLAYWQAICFHAIDFSMAEKSIKLHHHWLPPVEWSLVMSGGSMSIKIGLSCVFYTNQYDLLAIFS